MELPSLESKFEFTRSAYKYKSFQSESSPSPRKNGLKYRLELVLEYIKTGSVMLERTTEWQCE